MSAREMGFSSDSIPRDEIAGRYHVEREIGRGGMATVYLCTDKTTETQVAIKVLRPELGSSVVVERFLREIAFASNLDHPQIPKVLDSGVIGEVPFYVMTYIDGESLRARLQRVKQLTVDEAVRITQEIIKPTAYAHARGIIHRDLKPANILIRGDSVFVLDFGVARAIMASSSDETLTSTGVAVGTPAYMSPEQALADRDLDTRSDIYSLACVTYEMIAGIPPFVGATPQSVMARRFASPPPRLTEIRESVPQVVEEAIARAMCKAPADRWQTVEEFSRALSGRLTTPSILAHRVVLGERRRNYAKVLIAVMAIAVIGGGAAAWSFVKQDYVAKGRTAFESWDLQSAETLLRKAVDKGPRNPSAQLWLAQLLMLKGAPQEEWHSLALRSAERKSELNAFDQRRVAALTASVSDTSSDRCAAFQTLASSKDPSHPDDFSASLAYADCLVRDQTVIADASSPSGFRFRRSYQRVALLYEELATLNRSNSLAFKALMPRLERVLVTNKNALRRGIERGDVETQFIAWPELRSDSLAYVPVRLSAAASGTRNERSLERAITRNLATLERLAQLWTANAPLDPDAHEMFARMLEAGGKLDGDDASAISHVSMARNIAEQSAGPDSEGAKYLRRVSLGMMQVRMSLKLGKFESASMLADSILTWKAPRNRDDSAARAADEKLAGLAALTGRLGRVMELELRNARDQEVSLPSGEVTILPNEIARDAVALRTYAALGAPAESIIVVRDRISSRLGSLLPSAKADEVRASLFARPLSLAAPSIGVEPGGSLNESAGPFVRVLRNLARGNRRAARAAADSLSALHPGTAPGEITMDAVLQESWLRAAAGDTLGATTFLDNSLGGLSRAPPNLLARPMLAASLVRAMILRSQLASRAGDEAKAKKWSAAAVSLWQRGDAPMLELLRGATELHR